MNVHVYAARVQVLLEGVDVKDLKQASLRSAVAVVPQDTVLFNETILANIAYGRPGASREEIIRAAGIAIALPGALEMTSIFFVHLAAASLHQCLSHDHQQHHAVCPRGKQAVLSFHAHTQSCAG